MNSRCYCVCQQKNTKVVTTGWRSAFYFPGGGTYHGCWSDSKHHNFGVKESNRKLIYDGQWKNGQRHGHGEMRQRLPNGNMKRIYIGEWFNDKKHGEGQQYYEDGVYYGWWKNSARDGLGIQWYKDGSIYVGEWQSDVHHGIGVYYCASGNRYEGNFERGFKNGEGTFYHMHTGQLQKGVWLEDICKSSMVQDDFRGQVEQPTQYSIPEIKLAEPNKFIEELFKKYTTRKSPPRSHKVGLGHNRVELTNFQTTFFTLREEGQGCCALRAN